jgi:hypothetical protein
MDPLTLANVATRTKDASLPAVLDAYMAAASARLAELGATVVESPPQLPRSLPEGVHIKDGGKVLRDGRQIGVIRSIDGWQEAESGDLVFRTFGRFAALDLLVRIDERGR